MSYYHPPVPRLSYRLSEGTKSLDAGREIVGCYKALSPFEPIFRAAYIYRIIIPLRFLLHNSYADRTTCIVWKSLPLGREHHRGIPHFA